MEADKNLYIRSTLLFYAILLSVAGIFPEQGYSQSDNGDILLYTPYISRSATPGQQITYGIEIYNRTDNVQNMELSVFSLPNSWNPVFSSNNNVIQEIAVKPESLDSGNSSENVELSLTVPLRIRKGTYRYIVRAESKSGNVYELPLAIQVTKQGTFETELQIDQPNMEGYTDSELIYQATLHNRTAKKRSYSLTADAPPGWDVRFMHGSGYATSISLESNKSSENLSIRVQPAPNAEADTFEVVISARSGNTGDSKTLEAVIKGKYEMQFTTPSGRLSTEITSGSQTDFPVVVRNTGTVPLRKINLSSRNPAGWDVIFENDHISIVEPGASKRVNATIKASEKAIAGDYELELKANSQKVSSVMKVRTTVQKPVTWGAVGFLIILVVLGGISFLFKKYGRR